jgi:hypothetical protein
MNFSHVVDEKSSFDLTGPYRHILAYLSHLCKKVRFPMFKAYPLYMMPQNERRSSKRGFWATLLELLGRGSRF